MAWCPFKRVTVVRDLTRAIHWKSIRVEAYTVASKNVYTYFSHLQLNSFVPNCLVHLIVKSEGIGPLLLSVIVSLSSTMGDGLYRNNCTDDPTLLLRVSDPTLLEETQGERSEEGLEGSSWSQECTAPWWCHEGKSMYFCKPFDASFSYFPLFSFI